MADKTRPRQTGLFGAQPDCPDLDNLPLIVDPQGMIEVMAPGSVYQPLLLSSKGGVELGPGRLDEHEEALVRDLIRRLYPAGDHPKSDKTPLQWGHRELWLKRNIEKQPNSFRLRVDDSDWFYPDFIVWIIDPATRTQTFGFVDPKGLTLGLGGGWSDYKIVSTLYMPHVIERQLAAGGQQVEYEGEPWTFRIRGVLVSTSPYATLKDQAKFNIVDGQGKAVAPTVADFRRARIVFQHGTPPFTYIDEVLGLLTEDGFLDDLLAKSARLFDPDCYFEPAGEAEHDLALRRGEHMATETAWVADLIRDYLQPDGQGEHGTWPRKNRRLQLMDYAVQGKWGFGAEKIADIRDHPTPCEELWKRKTK